MDFEDLKDRLNNRAGFMLPISGKKMILVDAAVEEVGKFMRDLSIDDLHRIEFEKWQKLMFPDIIKLKFKNDFGIMDSTAQTLKHKARVAQLLHGAIKELLDRADNHDNSKLEDPEKSLFDKYTPKLKGSIYGSAEYKKNLDGLGHALEHHYKYNSHHPEHYPDGISGFDLFDLMEMLFDWQAAVERHEDGDIFKSLDINRERFGISDQLFQILYNTVANGTKFISPQSLIANGWGFGEHSEQGDIYRKGDYEIGRTNLSTGKYWLRDTRATGSEQVIATGITTWDEVKKYL